MSAWTAEDMASAIANILKSDTRTLMAWEAEIQLFGDQINVVCPDESYAITVRKSWVSVNLPEPGA